MNLERVFTIPEVAGLAGWDRRRMLRHLLRLDAELGGLLLHNIGTRTRPRYTITMRALKGVAPQWFTDPEAIEGRLAKLEEQIELQRELIRINADALQRLATAC